jgi:hypothetical protein
MPDWTQLMWRTSTVPAVPPSETGAVTAVAAHVIARAAALTGAPLWKGTSIDERPAAMTRLTDSNG